MKFKNKETGKILDQEGLAIELAKNGAHIVYCDLEGVAQIIDGPSKGDLFLIDECDNAVWIDYDKYEVI